MSSQKPIVLVVVTLAETGGAQAYVRELTAALTPSYGVVVAAHGPGPLAAQVTASGARFVPLRHVTRPIAPVEDLRGLIELWRLCRMLRPAVIHVNSAKAGILGRLAGWLAGVPSRVYTVHGWAFKVPGDPAAPLYRLAERALAPLTTLVICVSERERAAGLGARACRAERTVVIPNAVRASVAPTRAHGRSRPVHIISVGRLAPPKDFSTLLAAFGTLSDLDATLDVVGDGPQRDELLEQIAAVGLTGRARLVGEVDDVPERLAAADVFVLSSRSEGLPISVLEAMAAGLPVVASDVGGLGELVVDGETGFLVPALDVPELAERLRELVRDDERRASMGEASRRRVVERFDQPSWAAEHLRLYESLLPTAPRTL